MAIDKREVELTLRQNKEAVERAERHAARVGEAADQSSKIVKAALTQLRSVTSNGRSSTHATALTSASRRRRRSRRR